MYGLKDSLGMSKVTSKKSTDFLLVSVPVISSPLAAKILETFCLTSPFCLLVSLLDAKRSSL